MEDNQNLSQPSSNHRVSITAIIIYVLLALTASISVGGGLSWLFTFNMADFEGGSGYAAIFIFMLTASISFLASLVALPIMIKKAPKFLPHVMWIFAGLTLLLGLFN
ncbi:hypothetical protein AWW72_09070 [Acinetobacter sp. NRRL B-65365]|uniref:hypothetical protein n=1 Tax=Acinetobacter sp. NRRL B-65365 TaxID=1785092 RepID=UPI0007A01DFB|nr:hypothetical protein [Acinetobacter sp. NRRL B-65365]KYQ84530.1 hypothetical protein AWW72_09070 [Acinetobacter sp. NRRL B-65365]